MNGIAGDTGIPTGQVATNSARNEGENLALLLPTLREALGPLGRGSRGADCPGVALHETILKAQKA